MSKAIYKYAKVTLGGVDVSDILMEWSLGARIGELYVAEISLMACDRVVIEEGDKSSRRNKNGARVAINDNILIDGVNIQNWISGYDKIVRVGQLDVWRLYVQCDCKVLSINGGYPWENSA